MAIRNPGTSTLDSLAALGRSILEKAFAILGQLSLVATSAQLTAAQAEIARAIASNEVDLSPLLAALAPVPGSGARFMRASIPPGFAEVGTESANAPTLGAYLSLSAANIGSSVSTSSAYVTGGDSPGLWRYAAGSPLNGFQRFDPATNSALGPRYNGPMPTYAFACPFMVAIGQYIYMAGFNTAMSTGSANFYRFNTETGANEALASFPRALQRAEAVALPDGRLLCTSGTPTGITQTPSAWAFWVYDPATNAPPVEVVVDIKISQFASSAGEGLGRLPSGGVLLVERYQNANSSRQSVVLHVGADNSVSVSSVEEVNVSGNSQLCQAITEAGVHLFNPVTCVFMRTYVEGRGWGAPALNVAFPSTSVTPNPNGPGKTSPLPAGGWAVSCMQSNGTTYHGLLCPGVSARGDALVDVYKL